MIAPQEFMYFPPGEFATVINGFDRTGKPKTTKFSGEIVEQDAVRMNNYLQRLRRQGLYKSNLPFPYFDYDHLNEGHTFYPQRFWWGGSDPIRGGVRVKGYWTELGERLIATGVPLFVSPAFSFYPKSGNIDGLGYNLGAITAMPAFRANQPIISKAAAAAWGFCTDNWEAPTKEAVDAFLCLNESKNLKSS